MGLALFHIQKVLQVNIVLSKIALVLQLGNIHLRVEHEFASSFQESPVRFE